MYGTCLFCSASLGTNEAIETFTVGSRVAFDAWQGRLWAVCGRCGRWNLAPLESRWEAVEQAERLFTDTRTRVQSENIGLCRLADGTRLIRVGEALPGELAAWRYGSQLVSRRRRNLMLGGVGVAGAAGTTAVYLGAPLLVSAAAPILAANSVFQLYIVLREARKEKRGVLRVPAERSPTGDELVIRRRHIRDAVLGVSERGEISVALPSPHLMHEWKQPAPGWRADAEPYVVTGDDAKRLVARTMVDYNSDGAKQQDVERALSLITEAGGPDLFARHVAASGPAITRVQQKAGWTPGRKSDAPTLKQVMGTFKGEVMPVRKYRNLSGDDRPRMKPVEALALEMALNEEAERRALEGELAALEAAWKEAEEIAKIADSLTPSPQISSRKRS